jgi:hypothetical protein
MAKKREKVREISKIKKKRRGRLDIGFAEIKRRKCGNTWAREKTTQGM